MRFHDLRKRKDAVDPRFDAALLYVIEHIFLSFHLQLRIFPDLLDSWRL